MLDNRVSPDIPSGRKGANILKRKQFPWTAPQSEHISHEIFNNFKSWYFQLQFFQAAIANAGIFYKHAESVMYVSTTVNYQVGWTNATQKLPFSNSIHAIYGEVKKFL